MNFWNDVVYSARMLRKTPGVSSLVVITLALGLGATTAVFSIIYAILLRPLPYPNAGRIVALYETKVPHDAATRSYVAPGDFLDWREQNRSFTAMAGFAGFHYILTGQGAPQHLWGGAVSAGWWQVFGTQPEIGRVFTAAEDRPNAPQVAVLTDGLWRTRFHADPRIIGKTIVLNGDAYTVLGVTPPEQTSLHMEVDFWTPLQRQILPERMRWHDSRFLQTFARLRPGVTMAQAADDLNRIGAAIKHQHPSQDVYGGAAVGPLREFLTGNMGRGLWIAFAVVGLVLLVACANAANLMLVRVGGRGRELAIRSALGASRGRILRQLLSESLCLTLLAGVGGIAIAELLIEIMRHFVPWQMPELQWVQLNPYVAAFSFALAALAGILFGVAPAMAVVHSNTDDVLRKTSRTATGGGRPRLRQAIAVAEIAGSLVLLAGAGLLLRSLSALQQVPLGFHSRNRVLADIALPRMKYQQDKDVIRFYANVMQRVRMIPGVQDAAVMEPAPLEDERFRTSFIIAGSNQYNPVALRLADDHSFSILDIPLLRGRGFTSDDNIDSMPVCVINEAMAKHYWSGQDAVGRFVTLTRGDAAGKQSSREIVGVVGNVRDQINLEPEPTVYVPYRQMPFPSMPLVLRTTAPPGSLRPAIEAAVEAVDAEEPLRWLQPLDNLIAEAQWSWRMALDLLAALAGLALLLSAVGVFGIASHLVREKTKEFGIRMALGASPAKIRRQVLGTAAAIGIAGIAAGIAVSAALARFVGSWIYGISAIDPVTFLAVAALLVGICLLASYLPARRAARVDPMVALRYE